MNPEIMPEERVSKRRLTPLRRLSYRLLAPLGHAVLRFWWGTCRIVSVSGVENFEAALARAPSLLPCYWHQHELFCARWLLLQMPRIRLGFLISPSVDGEVPAMIARRLGAEVIRGSSTHTGARALRDYYRLLVKENVSPVITPDGPKGPRFVFKSGAILLSQISGRPMLPMAYAASRAWLFAWDKFVLPWPFARIAVAIGPPVAIGKDFAASDGAAMEAMQKQMARELHRLFHKARESLQ